jgi:hypothetical protein
LGLIPGYKDKWHPDVFAPSFYTAFKTLRAVFPTEEVAEEVEYTFQRALESFEDEALSRKKEIRYLGALLAYAQRADWKGELCDYEGGLGIRN